MKIWSGDIHLLSFKDNKIYKGLVHKIKEYCDSVGYEFIDETDSQNKEITIEDLQKFIDSLKLPERIKVRDYQLNAVSVGLNRKRMTILSPTGSGKSLIIYLIIRYLDLKTLLIVPQIALTRQMYSDFAEYSCNDDNWNVEDQCAKISGGQDKNPTVVDIELEDNSIIKLAGDQTVKVIDKNKKKINKKAKDLTENDIIDDNWLNSITTT